MAPAALKDSLKSAWCDREIGRTRRARHIGIAQGIQGDCMRLIQSAATYVGGVDQPRTGSIQVRDEGVSAHRGGLISAWRGNSSLTGNAGNVSITRGIHGNAAGLRCPAAALAQKGGIDERRSARGSGIELRHEDEVQRVLKSARCSGEASSRSTGYISVAWGVQRACGSSAGAIGTSA